MDSLQLDFAAFEELVFFLQRASGAAQATHKQNRHANRHDQSDKASANKYPMQPALRHHKTLHPIRGYFRADFISFGPTERDYLRRPQCIIGKFCIVNSYFVSSTKSISIA
jgi:hypothetical protein